MKVAVASKDGLSINVHFGHAKHFKIYTLSASGVQYLETRNVDNYCLGNRSSQSAMAMILQTIADCKAVLVAKVGEGPAEKLAAIGVKTVDEYAYEAVEKSLLQYAQEVHKRPDKTGVIEEGL